MVTRKSALTKAITLALLTYAQPLSAEAFSSSSVLEWSEESQNSMFQTSVGMIGIVASQREETSHIARCVNGWYWGGDEEQRSAKNDSIRAAMLRFPEFHPQAVILAVVEKACGEF